MTYTVTIEFDIEDVDTLEQAQDLAVSGTHALLGRSYEELLENFITLTPLEEN